MDSSKETSEGKAYSEGFTAGYWYGAAAGVVGTVILLFIVGSYL